MLREYSKQAKEINSELVEDGRSFVDKVREKYGDDVIIVP